MAYAKSSKQQGRFLICINLQFSKVLKSLLFIMQLIYQHFFPKYYNKEEPSLKVTFCNVSVHKNQSKCQNTALLLVDVQFHVNFFQEKYMIRK